MLYEGLRVNFADMEAILEQQSSDLCLASLSHSGAYLLLKAVFCITSGRIDQGMHLLGILDQSVIFGFRWAFRSRVYQALGYVMKQYPPLFRDCTFQGPAMFVWTIRNAPNRIEECLGYCLEHQNDENITHQDRLEYRLVDIIAEAMDIHKRIRCSHSDAAQDSQCEAFLGDLSRLHEDTMDFPAVQGEILKLQYQTHRLLGLSDDYIYLEKLRETYEHCNDSHGLGLYWLLRGDYNASPASTTPIASNLPIRDSLEDYGGDSSIKVAVRCYPLDGSGDTEARTANNPHIGLKHALNCYKIAQGHFESRGTSSNRAVAYALLKQACILRIAFHSECNHDLEDGASDNDLFSRVIGVAESAGDNMVRDTASIYLMLRKNIDGVVVPTAIKSMVNAIVVGGNEVFGLCLGLLSLGIGNFFRYQLGDFRMAAHTFLISQWILNSSNNPGLQVGRLHAMMAHCRYLVDVGDFKRAEFDVLLIQLNMSVFAETTAHIAQEWSRHPRLLEYQEIFVSEIDIIRIQICSRLEDLRILTNSTTAPDMGSAPDYLPPFPTSRVRKEFLLRWNTWCEGHAIRQKYMTMSNAFQLHKDHGKLKDADESLRSFFQDDEVAGSPLLLAKALMIEAKARCNDVPGAKELLGSIEDDELLPTETFITLSTLSTSGQIARVEARELWRRRLRSLEIILSCCINAKDKSRAKTLLDRIESLSPKYFKSTRANTNFWTWQRCLTAAQVYEGVESFNLANQYYIQAAFFFMQIKAIFPDQVTRRKLLNLPDAARLFSRLARRHLLWTSDPTSDNRLKPSKDPRIDKEKFHVFSLDVDYGRSAHLPDALGTLEAGRARTVSGTLVNETGISDSGTEFHNTMEELLITVLRKDRVGLDEREKAEWLQLSAQLATKQRAWEQSVAQGIWRGSNASDNDEASQTFPINTAILLQSIPQDAVLIYTDVDDEDLVVFAVNHKGIQAAAIRLVQARTIEQLVFGCLSAIVDDKEDPSRSNYYSSCLSKIVLEPMEKHLDVPSHVIFAVSGVLSRFPLGMLIYKDGYLLAKKQVSQVPSLTALHHLRSRKLAQPAGGLKTSAIARTGSVADCELTGIEPLFMAGVEAQLIRMTTASYTGLLRAENVTRDEFLQLVQTSDILHISTHGYIDTEEPFNSSILLKDKLRVLDLLSARSLRATLVVFSACLSGTGKATASGDVQGFSHAIIAAGVNAYVGALWKANDLATMIHMCLFYSTLMDRMGKHSIAEAWHKATRYLQRMDTDDIIYWLEQSIRAHKSWEAAGGDPNNFGPGARRKLETAVKRLRDGRVKMDFRHPYYWAAFSVIGNGAIRFDLQHLSEGV